MTMYRPGLSVQLRGYFCRVYLSQLREKKSEYSSMAGNRTEYLTYYRTVMFPLLMSILVIRHRRSKNKAHCLPGTSIMIWIKTDLSKEEEDEVSYHIHPPAKKKKKSKSYQENCL